MNPAVQRVSYARIAERLRALKMSENEASSLASNGRDRNLINRIKRNPDGNPRTDTLQRLAAVLQTNMDYLLGIGDDLGLPEAIQATTVGVPLLGKVEAGRYHLVDELAAESEPVIITASRHPRFPNALHAAYEVVGDCMNALDPKPIMPGDVAICVDWAATGYVPVTGMVVVVEQTRDGGHMRELTLKQVEVREGGIALCPRSHNKLHREIWLPKEHEDDGRTVRVVGLAFSIQSSLNTVL